MLIPITTSSLPPPYNAISTLNVGDSVFCKENGTDTEFILVHKGLPSNMYDASCNGAWLLRKDIYSDRAWNGTNNKWQTSGLQQWLRDTYVGYLNISSIISTVKIPYALGGASSTVYSGSSGLTSTCFLLGSYELGFVGLDQYMPADGAALSYFSDLGTSVSQTRIAYLNGTAKSYWTRTPYTTADSAVWSVYTNGSSYNLNFVNQATLGVRPAFIVPLNTSIDSSNNIAPVTIAETWLINATFGTLSDKTFNVNFVSNDTEYSQFWIGLRMGDYQIRYDDTLVFDADGAAWQNQAYRTIGLYEPASGDFLTWLNANAVKQS